MRIRILCMVWFTACVSFLLGFYVSTASAETPIAGMPGLEFSAQEAFSSSCTVASYSGVLRDPPELGGGSVTYYRQQFLICLNPAVLSAATNLGEILGIVWNGGFGWNISPANSGSMPGFLAFVRNRLFQKFGARVGIIIAPLLDHMLGGSGQSTGASISNARLDAVALLTLRALGISSSRTVVAGFSRGGEASIATISRYQGACSAIDMSGSYNNGLSTPTPALIDSLSSSIPLNLFSCSSGDTWALPYIGNLHTYRKNPARVGGALPGVYVAGACSGHSEVLMDPVVSESFDAAMSHDCSVSNFLSDQDRLPTLRKLSSTEIRRLKRGARSRKSTRRF